MEIQINRSGNELTHWGVKGQKWGVRRYQNPDGTLTEAGKKHYYYQNPDGSLTEEGKKHYMTAAKKGKINPRKLSDADLNMINSRFAREKQYAQNVSEYEKSKFSYKLKEAAISRIKGNGGGGGGKKGGGGTGLGKMLAMPIKKAFEDAIKFDPGKGGGNDGGGDDGYDRKAVEQYREYKKNGHAWQKGYKWSKNDEKNRAKLEKAGKRFWDTASTTDWSTGEKRTSGSRSAEDIVKERYKTSHPKTTPKSKPVVSVAAKKEKEWDRMAERAAKSGIIISHKDTTNYVVRRLKPSESLTT